MIAIRYIGKRDKYLENTYGSRIVFQKGTPVLVPDDIAAKLLKHPEYEKGDVKKAVEVHFERPEVKQLSEETALQDMRDLIRTMPVDALIDLAKNDYGRKLDKRKSEEVLRNEVTQLIDQYGLVA